MLGRRRRRGLFALALVVGLVAVGCARYPAVDRAWVRWDNKPTTVPGQDNGRLDTSRLTVIDPNCKIWADAAPSLRAMLDDANAAGVALAPEDCYRDFDGQVYWRNVWCWFGQCGNAAVPGTSNHGWAKAIDLKDQQGELVFGSPGWIWMRAHAADYGWNWPWPSTDSSTGAEPWHFEWVGDGGQLFGPR